MGTEEIPSRTHTLSSSPIQQTFTECLLCLRMTEFIKIKFHHPRFHSHFQLRCFSCSWERREREINGLITIQYGQYFIKVLDIIGLLNVVCIRQGSLEKQ